MTGRRNRTRAGGISARLLVGGALLGLCLPTAGLALGGVDGRGVLLSARGSFASFTPASIDPQLAKLLNAHPHERGRMMRFTPAGSANRPDRSVTVAIRVDEETARAITVRSSLAAGQAAEPGAGAPLILAPTRFNLGVARGYKSFAQAGGLPGVQKIEMPDLSTYKPAHDEDRGAGRFTPRIAVEEKSNGGRLSPDVDPLTTRSVDVGGSYRLLRNLDVKAGLRYSQQKDRLGPLTDGSQDSQAVYVGTQFRF